MKPKHARQAVDILNHILEMELAGTIHYTHYSFMVFGYGRIPIVKWLEEHCKSVACTPQVLAEHEHWRQMSADQGRAHKQAVDACVAQCKQ